MNGVHKIVFGPVPSRRLGLSLGVNNIPPKICTYSCIYCQVGRTLTYEVERKAFYEPSQVIKEVEHVLDKEKPDYVTFVPDGEPTLDENLGFEIKGIKELGTKIAVITNGSLLYRKDVRDDLMYADLVSVKVDTVDEKIYLRVNRPHGSLSLSKVLEGKLTFSHEYEGELITETMLVRDVNDGDPFRLAEFLNALAPKRAYIAVPIRPPAEPWVKPPKEDRLLAFYEVVREVVDHVELLSYPEEGEFRSGGGRPEEELLLILSVHPMRIEKVKEFLRERASAPEAIIKALIKAGKVKRVRYLGKEFLVRNLE